MNTKGVQAIGFLIILIGVIVVTVTVVGLILDSNQYFQSKALTDGGFTTTQTVTNIQAVQLEGYDGSDGAIDNLLMTVRLAPGSDTIRMSNVFYTESTSNTTASLQLRENATSIKDVMYGYYTATSAAHPYITQDFHDEITDDFRAAFPSPSTSAFFAGKIAISIIFVESNGTVDTNVENWTVDEQDAMIDATLQAMNWWNRIEPRAAIRSYFDIHRDVPISYEPISRDTDITNQTLWMNEALDYLGIPDPGTTILDRTRRMADRLRNDTNAHWAFIFFIADSSETGAFTDGNAGIAYINGPHTFVGSDAFGSRPEVMIAHEFGHIFGARDQYTSSGCACTDTGGVGGFYSIQTQNCDVVGCVINQTSIMRAGAEATDAYDNEDVDVYALSQMGIINTNYDYKIDAVEVVIEGTELDEVYFNQSYLDLLVQGSTGYRNPILDNQAVGFFTVQDPRTGLIIDDLDRSELARIYHETARPIYEEEVVRITFNPKTGNQYIEEFYTPYTIVDPTVFLYR